VIGRLAVDAAYGRETGGIFVGGQATIFASAAERAPTDEVTDAMAIRALFGTVDKLVHNEAISS